MQELQTFRELVINFQHGGNTKKNHETEVDHGVHEASC